MGLSSPIFQIIMIVMRHVGFRLDSEEERIKLLGLGIEFTSDMKMPRGGILATIDLAEDDPRWESIDFLLGGRRKLEGVAARFSEADLDAAKFLRIAGNDSGYPQPESVSGYLAATYDLSDYCGHCGIGKKQTAPFRLKGQPALRDNSILQLNWVPDEYFVTRATWEALFKPLGIGMRTVVVNRTGLEIASVVQLEIPHVCDLTVGDASSEECSRCNRKKYSPSFRGFLPKPIAPKTPIFKSAQSFGTGAQAFKLVIVTDALYRTIKQTGFTRVEFYPCAE